jgi:hypothetical protein
MNAIPLFVAFTMAGVIVSTVLAAADPPTAVLFERFARGPTQRSSWRPASFIPAQMLQGEPALQFVAPDHRADHQVVGAVVAAHGRFSRERPGLDQDELVRIDEPAQLV